LAGANSSRVAKGEVGKSTQKNFKKNSLNISSKKRQKSPLGSAVSAKLFNA
jgi:hypothetical protein